MPWSSVTECDRSSASREVSSIYIDFIDLLLCQFVLSLYHGPANRPATILGVRSAHNQDSVMTGPDTW